MLTEASNKYAHLSGTGRQKGWRGNNPENLSNEELKTYFGDRLHMGLFGLQNVEDCWVKEFVDNGHVIQLYQNTFSHERFQDISANLHVTWEQSNPGDSTFDKVWKVRPLITLLQGKFSLYWNPCVKVSIDEMGIASKASISFLQFNPSKPHKWMFKVFLSFFLFFRCIVTTGIVVIYCCYCCCRCFFFFVVVVLFLLLLL